MHVLPRIISPLQAIFIQGRNIHDNILVAHEILNSLPKKSNKQGCKAIKLDLEKAYDKLKCFNNLSFV